LRLILQVDNNNRKDYLLRLVDAPSEDEVLEARVRAYEEAEAARLAAISEAEAKLAAAADDEREKARL
jgi:putative heme iron utilization protein